MIHKIIQSNKPLHAQHRRHTLFSEHIRIYTEKYSKFPSKRLRIPKSVWFPDACYRSHIYKQSIFIHTRIHPTHSHSYVIMYNTCTFQPCSSGWVPLVPVCLCPFWSRLCQCTIKCPLHIHITRTNTAQGRAPQRSQKFRVGENLQINRHCWPGQIRVVFFVSLFVY